jgi:hypothetical protein
VQVYDRSLVTGSDRASIFAWAVFSALMHKHSNESVVVDVHNDLRSPEAPSDGTEREHWIFQHHRSMRVSLQLLSDILFADMYPRDCAIVDWDAASPDGSNKDVAADAACRALLMMMDAAAWTYGVVLATDCETTSGVNFEHSSWVKSTPYRFAPFCYFLPAPSASRNNPKPQPHFSNADVFG